VRVIPWLLTVSGAVWVTGNAAVATAAVAAFHWQRNNPTAISREGLGGALGAGFAVWSSLVALPLLVTMISLGWLAGSAWRAAKRARAAWLVMAMLLVWGVHSVNRQTIDEANQLANGIREMRAAAATNPTDNNAALLASLEQRFAVQHLASERWHGIETALALGLLLGGSYAALRRPASSAVAASP